MQDRMRKHYMLMLFTGLFAFGHFISAAAAPAIQSWTAQVFGPVINGQQLSTETPYYSYQWALKNTGNLWGAFYPNAARKDFGPGKLAASSWQQSGQSIQGKAGIDIGVEPAWQVYEAGKERRTVTVALIDTGVDIAHPDLQSAIWVNEDEIPGDGMDNDGNGYIDDINGWNFFDGNANLYHGNTDDHGTHGAGTIAGAWNGKGITGIADSQYVKIMVLKALGDEDGRGCSDRVKEAIRYAEANGADICNLSMGTTHHDGE